MDSELAPSVDYAVSIATSGRWAALNERIVHYAGTPEAGGHLHFPLFGKLVFRVFNEYLALKAAYYEPSTDDLSLIAWRARNLLELRVWAVYFCRDEQSARRIYVDAGWDARDLFKAMTKWGTETAQPEDWTAMFDDADSLLVQRASLVGIDDLDGSYKAVSAAARECGLEAEHALQFKLLSKFAHPTAMQIMGAMDDGAEQFRDLFFSRGCALFSLTFNRLETYLSSDNPPWRKPND